MKKLTLLLLLLAPTLAHADEKDLFKPEFGSTESISATTSSASATIDAGDGATVNFFNSGTVAAFCKVGTGSVTATTADLPVAAGGYAPIYYKKPNAQTDRVAACITASGSTTVYVFTGAGGG